MANPNSKNKIGSILKGKGFYVALALCLVGAGVAAWAAVNSTIDDITENTSSYLAEAKEENEWLFPELERVDKPENSVPIESSSSDTSSQTASSSGSSSSSATNTSNAVNSSATSQQYYMLPVSGEVINKYSGDTLVMSVTLGDYRTHNGVDFKTKLGAPVKAVAGGTITSITTDDVWGTTIQLTHPNGIVSVYSSLSDTVSVKVNDVVEIGDILGSVDNSALCESALDTHLHFEMMQNGVWLDPLETMGKTA
ncbi:MAG: M23 family metallopeptidase [Oscillospiraceae bacterium]|nr:M23 family metallopeptidase [Oscillospiraceae bacterium]